MIKKVLALLAVASVAVAGTEVTPYIGLGVGYGALNDSTIKANGVEQPKSTYDDGMAFEALVGVKLDKGVETLPLRVEGAFSYQSNDDDMGDEVRVMTLMGNAYLDFFPRCKINPYIMGGVGAANIEGTVGASEKHDENSFVGQVGAGIGYYLTEHVVLDLKYKYLMTNQYKYRDSLGNELDVIIDCHNLLFGVRYEF